jgi:hypothetical protein
MKPVVSLILPPLFLLMGMPAQAYELQTDSVVVCDTQTQVERYAQLFDGDAQVAIGAVNSEAHNPTACANVDVTYVEGPGISVARSGSHTFRIVPIVVVAADTVAGYKAVEPGLFYTLVEIVEYSV